MLQRAGSYIFQKQNAPLAGSQPSRDPKITDPRANPMRAAAEAIDHIRGRSWTLNPFVSPYARGAIGCAIAGAALWWFAPILAVGVLGAGALCCVGAFTHRHVEQGLINMVTGSNQASYGRNDAALGDIERSLREQGYLNDGRQQFPQQPAYEAAPTRQPGSDEARRDMFLPFAALAPVRDERREPLFAQPRGLAPAPPADHEPVEQVDEPAHAAAPAPLTVHAEPEQPVITPAPRARPARRARDIAPVEDVGHQVDQDFAHLQDLADEPRPRAPAPRPAPAEGRSGSYQIVKQNA